MFGAIDLAKNSDIDKYKYSGYGIGLDARGTFIFPGGDSFAQNAVIFGADMKSFVYANNRTKNILVLVKEFIQGIANTAIYTKKRYSINFIPTKKRFCLNLRYNGNNSYLLVNGTEIIKFKAKYSEIVANPLCLGNISEDFSESNMKKTELYGPVYDFSIDHQVIAVDDILDIYKYLTKNHGT